MFGLIWINSKLLELARRAVKEERGLVLIEWLIIGGTMAVVAAAVVLLFKGPIEHEANKIVTALSG